MEISNQNKMLIVVGIVFCIALAVLSPYIASGDPDGLEKSAEDSSVAEDVESPVLEAPTALWAFTMWKVQWNSSVSS